MKADEAQRVRVEEARRVAGRLEAEYQKALEDYYYESTKLQIMLDERDAKSSAGEGEAMTDKKPRQPLGPIERHDFAADPARPTRCAACGFGRHNRVHQ